MKNRLEYIIFIAFSYFFRLLGIYLSRRFAVVIAVVFFYIIPIRKSVTIKNLAHAFPELSRSEINKIAFSAYKSFAVTLAEILITPSVSKEMMAEFILCENTELIQEKHNEGKGVILLSAHFANWEYLANSMAIQSRKKFTVIVKPLRNELVSNWMNAMRTRWINDVVNLGVSIRQIFAALKNKDIVAMVADQRGPEDSIKLNFFGRKTSVLVGPAALALKTGAPIIYGIAVRQKDFSYHLKLEEISTENLPSDFNESIEELSRRHLSYLESMIKKHPEQWLWMHNRWRH